MEPVTCAVVHSSTRQAFGAGDVGLLRQTSGVQPRETAQPHAAIIWQVDLANVNLPEPNSHPGRAIHPGYNRV
jgi:hypothetical protein